ncbi:MAG: S-layer homology domain-containing protein [Clostridia bacterium]|nr:S-layer homology domain-containing protein [Clostridia bacterium]
MRRRASCFVTALFMLLFCIPAYCAQEENFLSGGDFEEQSDMWNGGFVDAAAAYEGSGGIQIINPFGSVVNGTCAHILEYNPTVELEAGKFYSVSMYVMNPLSEQETTPSARVSLSESADNILVTVRSVGALWTQVSDTFYITESGTYSLSFQIMGGDEYMGFFADSAALFEVEEEVDRIVFRGPSSLFVPDEGTLGYTYSVQAFTENGKEVDVLSSSIEMTSQNLPDGVIIDNERHMLRVSSDAKVGAEFAVRCTAPAGMSLNEPIILVALTKNMLENPSFENTDITTGWSSDIELNISDSRAELYAVKDGEHGFYATLLADRPLFLRAGLMYVFKAHVYTDEDYGASIYAQNAMTDENGTLTVDILGITTAYSREVVAAFTPERDGVYQLAINLWTNAATVVYVDDVSLTSEEEDVEYITLHAPGNIARATEEYSLPYSVFIRNQAGAVMEGETAQVYLSPEGKGVTIDSENSLINISPIAEAGDYSLYAVSDTNVSVTQRLEFSVSSEYVGDGGFEERAANEWWTAYSPARFEIDESGDSKRGRVTSADTIALMINNSYMRLETGDAYALKMTVTSDFPVTVIAFLDDVFNADNDVPLAQFVCAGGGSEEFSEVLGVDETTIGRLMLYIESDGAVDVLFDDIAMFEAVVAASGVRIEGVCEVGQSVIGEYTYINNLIEDYADNASQTRWYISSIPTGGFSPVGTPNSAQIELTEEMLNQYIVFEVVPICAKTGMYGSAVRSAPRLVCLEEGGDIEITPAPPDEEDRPQVQTGITPITLASARRTLFSDITGHWAQRTIEIMSASGITNGRSERVFAPDDPITRAEFTAMLLRAFALIPTQYKDSFDDVSTSDWFAGTVETAVARGIANGVAERTFAPNEYITREQMALMIVRTYHLAEGEQPPKLELTFYDAYAISPWAYDSVLEAYTLGIVTGSEINIFLPQRSATRAEAAAMIYRLVLRLS